MKIRCIHPTGLWTQEPERYWLPNETLEVTDAIGKKLLSTGYFQFTTKQALDMPSNLIK